MKNIKYIIPILLILFSCNDNLQEEFVDTNCVGKQIDSLLNVNKIRGDNHYDVLGFAFDATGEYLNPLPTLLPVIDVNLLQANTGLIISDDPTHTTVNIEAGSDAKTMLLKYNKKFSVDGKIPVDGIPFTGSISDDITKSLTVVSKYSYAMANVNVYISHYAIKKQTDIAILQNYLTQTFRDDINTKTPEQIISLYGTHVYTDIYTGGSVRFKYKSNIKTATKEGSVAYGVKIGVGEATGTNFSVSSSSTITETESVAYELQTASYYSVGGDGGTSMIGNWSPGKDPSPNLNFNQWSASVKESIPHSLQLIDIGDQSLMAIYEFVADPAKKAALKAAVDDYILGKSFRIVPVVPLYMYKNKGSLNHFYTTDFSELGYGYEKWEYKKIAAFVCEDQLTNTVPLHRFYRVAKDWFKTYFNHYYTRVYSSGTNYYNYEGVECYVYSTPSEGRIELYQLWNPSKHDHYYTTSKSDVPSGYGSKTICCYVY